MMVYATGYYMVISLGGRLSSPSSLFPFGMLGFATPSDTIGVKTDCNFEKAHLITK